MPADEKMRRRQPPYRQMRDPGKAVVCEGVQGFETWDIANAVQKRRSGRGKIGKVYKCRCGKFHIATVRWKHSR